MLANRALVSLCLAWCISLAASFPFMRGSLMPRRDLVRILVCEAHTILVLLVLSMVRLGAPLHCPIIYHSPFKRKPSPDPMLENGADAGF